jgi:hypothetical protein
MVAVVGRATRVGIAVTRYRIILLKPNIVGRLLLAPCYPDAAKLLVALGKRLNVHLGLELCST